MLGHVTQRPLRLFAVVLPDPGHGRLQFVFHFLALAGRENHRPGIFLAGFLFLAHHRIGIGDPQLRTKIGINPDAHAVLFQGGIELSRQTQNLAVGVVRVRLIRL